MDIDGLKTYLERVAKKDARSENEAFEPMDYSGGNFDDAFFMGMDDGEIFFAREILDRFFK